MLAASVCFAAMAALVKVCAKVGVPLAQTVFYRGVVSSLVAMAVMRFQGTPVRTPHWRAHLRRGGIGFVGIVVYFAGVMLLPLSAAVTLNYTSPLLLAGWLLYQGRERPPLALMLALGGATMMTFAPWVAAMVVVVFTVVVLSYRQNVHAYPSGGGDYEVVSENLGQRAGVFVASALLVDGDPEYRALFAAALAGQLSIESVATGAEAQRDGRSGLEEVRRRQRGELVPDREHRVVLLLRLVERVLPARSDGRQHRGRCRMVEVNHVVDPCVERTLAMTAANRPRNMFTSC